MSDKYDDIINLPRPESKYPRMPRANRAAQFSPFAALTGHEEAIRETVYCPTQGGVKPPPLGGGFSVSFVVCGHEQLS